MDLFLTKYKYIKNCYSNTKSVTFDFASSVYVILLGFPIANSYSFLSSFKLQSCSFQAIPLYKYI